MVRVGGLRRDFGSSVCLHQVQGLLRFCSHQHSGEGGGGGGADIKCKACCSSAATSTWENGGGGGGGGAYIIKPWPPLLISSQPQLIPSSHSCGQLRLAPLQAHKEDDVVRRHPGHSLLMPRRQRLPSASFLLGCCCCLLSCLSTALPGLLGGSMMRVRVMSP